MKVRIKNQPTGLYNGADWPVAGETIELPDHVAEGMINAGNVEKVEEKPAPEKRPAVRKNVETRKQDDGDPA